MIEKQCQFSGQDERGLYFHLLHPGYDDSIELIKEAQVSAPLLDEVKAYLKGMGKPQGKQHVLLSALGAGEFWGANTNGDFFPENSLIHTPMGWHDLSQKMQRMVGAKWEWGYPTFYNAHAFQHHVNKDPARAFGDVELACWDADMKRVLLVVGINRSRAKTMGATGVVDKIDNGEFPDVSMGCRVPFDLCSVCTDWDRITGNPKKDLAEHRRSAIRGLSVTTKDYCQHLRFEVGRLYPDGRKVWMWNLHPRFFDISFVFIGADKASKVMAKLAHCPIRADKKKCASCVGDRCDIPSAHVHDVWSREMEKAASYQAFPEFEDPEDEKRINKIIKANQRRLSRPTFGRTKVAVSPTGVQTRLRKEERAAMKAKGYEFDVDAYRKRGPKGWLMGSLGLTADPYKKVNPAPVKTASDDMATIEEAFSVEDPKDLTKLATLSMRKKAEIIKRITSHFNRAMPTVGADEPDIPKETLDEMSKCPAEALGTAGGMGIVLKPREFQRVYVRAIGKPDLADALEDRGITFEPGGEPDPHFSVAKTIIPKILEALRPLMGERSALAPPLHRRRFTITVIKAQPKPVEHELLDKVASAYAAYRRDLVYNVTDLVPRAIHEHPAILGDITEADLFHEGGAGLVKAGSDVVQSLLGMFPTAYINRAYLPGPVSQYVEDHTNFAGLRAAGALATSGGVA